MIEVLLGSVAGLIFGVVISWLLMKSKLKMYAELWQNEKNGNYVLTKEISRLSGEPFEVNGEPKDWVRKEKVDGW